MVYLFIKLVHILSATILFGTGIGTASVMLYAHLTKDTRVIAAVSKYVVIADWIFTASSGIILPISGLILVLLSGYALFSTWIIGSIMGYAIAALCWVIIVYLRIKIRDYATYAYKNQLPLPSEYHRCILYWFCLAWPVFLSLIFVFYLMTVKPV